MVGFLAMACLLELWTSPDYGVFLAMVCMLVVARWQATAKDRELSLLGWCLACHIATCSVLMPGASLLCQQTGNTLLRLIIPVLTGGYPQSLGSLDWDAQSNSFEACNSVKTRASLVFYTQLGQIK